MGISLKDLKDKKDKPALPAIPESSSIRAIRYLTLQGGGMKGIGFVGVVKSLEESGVLAQLEEVAGTSAGALAATLIAIGCSAEEIKQEMLTLNFKQFQDPEVPGWVETLHLTGLNVSNLFSSTDNKVEAIKQSLGNIDNIAQPHAANHAEAANAASEPLYHGVLDLAEKLGQVYSNLGLWQGDALSNWISGIVARKTGNPNITFAELAALSKQPLSPFKKLTLTGSNLTDKKLEYYNATETPNMSIVDAVRISASFPGAFKPFIRIENGIKKVLVDGGLLENLPNVFNKPPYINKNNMSQGLGNKESLAIVFKEPDRLKPSVIKNGLDLVKAMYATKMSSNALFEQYGDNIAYIDPMGVETLEFGASDTKRHNLAISGARSVIQAFNKILQKEALGSKNLQLHKLNDEALIRLKTAFQFELQQKKNDQTLLNNIVLINQEIERRKINPEKVTSLRRHYENNILQRQKKLQLIPKSDQELAQAYQHGIELYKRTDLQIKNRLQHLRLTKRALILRREEIMHVFEQDGGKNLFRESLMTLNDLQTKILHNREHFAKIEQTITQPPTEIGSAGNTRLLESEKLSDEYQKLMRERDIFFKNLQAPNEMDAASRQMFIDFFRDLHYNCMQDVTFKIPITRKDLRKHYTTDIQYCSGLIREAKIESMKTTKEQQTFHKYEKLLNEKTERSNRYSKLIHFKRELDQSILRKTTFLSKINHYLIKKGPTLKRIIDPFLKLASFTAFMCSLPFATLVVPIAKGIQYFSKNESTKSTASRFINFFKYTNIDYDTKLRGFQKTTAHLLHVMKKNYTQDKSESVYIQSLFAENLKHSGLKLKDLLMKNESETQENYDKRIEQAKKQLEIPNPTPVDLSLAPKAKANDKLSDELAESRFQSLKAKLERENMLLIHAEFTHNIKNKLHLKEALSKKEVQEYILSTEALQKPLSQKFVQHYQHLIQKPQLDVRKKLREPHLAKHKQPKESPEEQTAFAAFLKEKRNPDQRRPKWSQIPTNKPSDQRNR